MYCFTHGLPTLNAGSWMPTTNQVSCGRQRCQTLAAGLWQEMWRRGEGSKDSWEERKQLECEVCKTERARRCCVLGLDDVVEDRYSKEPFAHAPYIHPFNAPKYHAQQLKTVNFAKATSRRVLWVTAYDTMKTKDVALTKDKEEERKERWLEFHDRFTGGIMGLLPLVFGMPVRFTDTMHREWGVFKHSRGTLQGWELTEAEKNQTDALDDPEIVLEQRPLMLFVEVDSATAKMLTTNGKRFTLSRSKLGFGHWTKENRSKSCVWAFQLFQILAALPMLTAGPLWTQA